MNVLLIGYDEALSNHISAILKTNHLKCERLSIKEAIEPNALKDKASWADKIVLVTTDTFMGLGIDLSFSLEATTDLVNELVKEGGTLLHINSSLVLGKGDGVKPLAADSDWTDNLDWNNEAFMLHRIDREFWRGIAEGMNGCSLLVPIVEIENQGNNVAAQKASDFLQKGLYPIGKTGWLSQDSITAQLLSILKSPTPARSRYMMVDKNLTYRTWISSFKPEAANRTSIKPMSPSKRGLWSWIRGVFQRNKDFNSEFEHVLSSQLSYTASDKNGI